MPSVLWVSLPQKWTITEVQAGLQVIIAVLCTWGIFAFSRFCWQLSSNLVKKNRAVALASLMSINTIGEAYDVIALLKKRIFLQRYWKLLAQSIVVISLTVATIVSGPIAKASTRMGTKIQVITIPGLMATNRFNSRTFGNVIWNETVESLDRANFPLNQLLDFMPQANSSWRYKSSEWNSSWTMDCNKTENTPFTLYDSGQCGNASIELPATNDFFPYESFDQTWVDWHAGFSNASYLRDGLLLLTGWTWPGWDSSMNITYNMTITVAVVHIHGMNSAKATNASSKCNFGRGPVDTASYVKMECFMKRPQTVPDELHIAFPDAGDYFALPAAYIGRYYDRMAQESLTGKPITTMTADELIRFYQAYIITKDIQYPHAVNRQITADVAVVQLSSTFIAFGSLYALVVILGLINHGIFAYRNRDIVHSTPESKLDWIVQSILDESEAKRAAAATLTTGRRSVLVPSELIMRGAEKVRTVFENARYGGGAEEVPLTDHVAPQAGSYYEQSPEFGFYQSPPVGSYQSPAPTQGFMAAPTAYGGYAGEQQGSYTMNQYEASYAQQQYANPAQSYGPQSPQSIFTSDHRRGYQRLG